MVFIIILMGGYKIHFIKACYRVNTLENLIYFLRMTIITKFLHEHY